MLGTILGGRGRVLNKSSKIIAPLELRLWVGDIINKDTWKEVNPELWPMP